MAKKKKKRARKPIPPQKRRSKKKRPQKNQRWWIPMLAGAATLVAVFVGGSALLDYFFPKDKPHATRTVEPPRTSPRKTPKPAPPQHKLSGFLGRAPRAPADTLFSDQHLASVYEKALADLKAGKPPMPVRRRIEKVLPDANGDPGRPLLLATAAYTALKTRDGHAASKYLSTLERAFPDNPLGDYAKVMALDAAVVAQAQAPGGSPPDMDAVKEILTQAQTFADSGVEQDMRAYALFVAGKAYAVLDEKDKAAATYLEVADTYPEWSEASTALRRAADMLRQQRKVAGAIDVLERLIRDYPSTKTANQARKALRELRLIGKPARELQVEEWVNGEPSPLSSLRGKVVLLVFWQTWCPHCREELPHLSRLYETYRDKDLVVIGVTKNDRRQDEATLSAFLEANQLPFPVARVNPVSSADFAVTGVPAGVLIDKKGIIRERAHPSRLTRDLIDTLLAEAP